MSRTGPSLRARTALATVAAVAIVLSIVGVLLMRGFSAAELGALDERLTERAAQLDDPLRISSPFGLPPEALGDASEVLGGSDQVVRVFDQNLAVVEFGDTEGTLPIPNRIGFDTVTSTEGERFRALTVPLPGADGSVETGIDDEALADVPVPSEVLAPSKIELQVAASLAPVEQSVARLGQRLLLLALLALAAAGAVGYAFGGIALRSLQRLRLAATGVSSADDLSARVPAHAGPREVDDLAGALNSMLGRLERSHSDTLAALEATKRFTADAGHELRTPLTALGTNLETVARNPDMSAAERSAILAETATEHRRIVDLLDALQALARADSGAAVPREPVDLGEIIDAAVEAARRRHPAATAVVTIAPVLDAALAGWPQGLRLLLDNLLENAVRHGDDSARVEIGLARTPSELVLTVDDDGPGVPLADRERIFERFVRGSTATAEGSGLGLALVAQQASLHGGSVEIDDSPLGGARFRVHLAIHAAGKLRGR